MFTSECPPESLRPDRAEVITPLGKGEKCGIGRGSTLEYLVGKFNGARNLTTAIVNLAPSMQLDYHTHDYTEAVTVLEGALLMEVEGRQYKLNPLDNIVIPAGLAHRARNPSTKEPAVLHGAMPTDILGRTLVDDTFTARAMPDDATCPEGAEYVTRQRTAKRTEPGKNASFIDYFNENLVPGIQMSGGYGLFQPGGRLPAHLHDFDESICIVQGEATCIVEGRQYVLSGYATALQPRGRVHYFINESKAPMGMIWVYGGPLPERIVVAERYATAEGNPWK
jgi:quercetin dioxygenase-like cupin family protein